MLTDVILTIRERYHPLYHLRKLSVFRAVSRLLDFPVAIRVDKISHPICLSSSRNLSWILSQGRIVEADERENFLKLTAMAGCKRLYDIGANVGSYGFMFACVDPARSVVMFEPDPLNASLLRTTLRRFAVNNCELTEAAVCDRDDLLTFHSDLVSGATGSIRRDKSFIETHNHGKNIPLVVRSVSLDQFTSSGAQDPDVIKIDAEGAEISILRGAEGLFARTNPVLFFECDTDKAEIRTYLAERNYLLFDATTLEPADEPAHNTVALHKTRHSSTIESLTVAH